jgi:hypothetical protein
MSPSAAPAPRAPVDPIVKAAIAAVVVSELSWELWYRLQRARWKASGWMQSAGHREERRIHSTEAALLALAVAARRARAKR